jgi:hypothetical protein
MPMARSDCKLENRYLGMSQPSFPGHDESYLLEPIWICSAEEPHPTILENGNFIDAV